MNTSISGSVIHNNQLYDYQPVNPEDPLQGIRITCLYNKSIKLAPKDIQVNILKDIFGDCYCAAGSIYKQLEHMGLKSQATKKFGDGGEYSTFVSDEGNFICREIVQKMYLDKLILSRKFVAKKTCDGEIKLTKNNKN